MPLIFNGNSISAGSKILYNNTELQKIYCNDVLVWQKYVAATASITGGSSTIGGGGSAQPTYGDGVILYPHWNYNLSSLSPDAIIGWEGVSVKARDFCTIVVSGIIRVHNVDGGDMGFRIYLYKNNSLYKTYINSSVITPKDISLGTTTITLSPGETCSIRVHAGYQEYPNHRVRFFILNPIRFSATPL